MIRILLEDNFTDIIGKAQRGLKLSDDQLATRAGITVQALTAVKAGAVDEEALRKIARSLTLGKTTLVESAKKAWYPNAQALTGLAQFNTAYEDMTVNTYLVWDADTKEAAVFDTGATCDGALQFARADH